MDRLSRRNVLKIGASCAGALALGQTSIGCADAETVSAASDVYFNKNISGATILEIFQRVNKNIDGKIGIKLHVGEDGNKNYVSPDLVKPLCANVNGALMDSNVYYGGSRGNTAGHKRVAAEHGFNFAKMDILDENGSVDLPIKNGKHLKTAVIGANISNYDSIIVLTHFKGHAMAGFGGSIKNLAMGAASSKGKGIIHGGNWNSGDVFIEKLVEFCKGITDFRNGKICYINILNNLSVDCDCVGGAKTPVVADIGVVASSDLVAVEQASLDLVYKAKNNTELVKRIENRNGVHQIKYAEQLKMGNRKYHLIEL